MPPDRNKLMRRTTKVDRESRRTCSKCNRMGHIQSACTHPDGRIAALGIEVEGYWLNLPEMTRTAEIETGTRGSHDASLSREARLNETDDPDGEEDGGHCGCDYDPDCCPAPAPVARARDAGDNAIVSGWEFRTKPGTTGEALRQLTAVYPDATSNAAGMHVHVSFKDKMDISYIASKKFAEYHAERWKAWGLSHKINPKSAFWDRLNGHNRYCMPWEDHELEACLVGASQGIHQKYRQINLAKWHTTHPTVEFRLLPMFQKAKYAVSAVECLVDIVETWLARDWRTAEIVSPTVAKLKAAPVVKEIRPTTVQSPTVSVKKTELAPLMLDYGPDERSIVSTLDLELEVPAKGSITAHACDAFAIIEDIARAMKAKQASK